MPCLFPIPSVRLSVFHVLVAFLSLKFMILKVLSLTYLFIIRMRHFYLCKSIYLFTTHLHIVAFLIVSLCSEYTIFWIFRSFFASRLQSVRRSVGP